MPACGRQVNEDVKINDRFVIHFGIVGINEPTSQPELIQVWATDHIINIHNANNYTGNIKVFSIFGQAILKTKLTGNQNQQVRVDAPNGYYVINITTKKV